MTNNIIPIIFNGGSYGNFVRWCLLYFSGKITELPFLEDGSSHKRFKESMDREALNNIKLIQPKATSDLYKNSVLLNRIDNIANEYSKGILLYADYNSFLLNINNKFDKGFIKSHGGWLIKTESINSEMASNLKRWQVDNLSDMEPWQIREFLSYFIWNQHIAETEIDSILNYQNKQIIKIEIRQLVDNFQFTVEQLLDFCNFSKTRSNFDEIYQQWISRQKHIYKDQIVESIINSVVHNFELNWSDKNLSIVDEAVVQMKLRDIYNLDLLCHNLNKFPSNTVDLKKILIALETN